MDFKPATVRLERIDTGDFTYRITTAQEFDALKASIAAVGLINAPILTKRNADYVIVSGFRRVAACNGLGWDRIPARIALASRSGANLAMLAITENISQRPLNMLERARAAALLSSSLQPLSETAAAAKTTGIAESPEMLKKLLALNDLPGRLQSAVADLSISLPVALEVGGMARESADHLAALLSELRPSLNRQREIVGLLKEIARREGKDLTEIISEPNLRAIWSDSEGDRNKKIRRLLDELQQRRFPSICRTKRAFARLIGELRLGPGLSLVPPSHFEASTYTLQVTFRDLAELEKRRDALNSLVQNPTLIRFCADRFELSG